MTKLPRDANGPRVLRALRCLGFDVIRTRGSHHYMQRPEGGPLVCVPVHAKPLPVGTLASILDQAQISADDLIKHL